jgi:NADH-quinone oxidoreductase subunit N
VGLAFKVAAAPFQLWTPDVYEGAPAPVTAMLSTGPKAAAFALALRVLANVEAASALWFWALWIAAVLSMFAGNLGALVQTNIKRMLAYSSIAHAGYILVALAAAAATDHPEAGIAAALFYLVSYALVKLSAFLIVAQLGGTGERHVEIEDFTGLAHRQPAMAACLSLLLLSLLGLPVTAGFLGKFYVFNAALESNLIWLAILLALNSVIGAYYYLRVMVAMYMREPNQEIAAEPVPWTLSIVLWIAAAGTVYVGLLPTRVIGFAAKAALNMR